MFGISTLFGQYFALCTRGNWMETMYYDFHEIGDDMIVVYATARFVLILIYRRELQVTLKIGRPVCERNRKRSIQ